MLGTIRDRFGRTEPAPTDFHANLAYKPETFRSLPPNVLQAQSLSQLNIFNMQSYSVVTLLPVPVLPVSTSRLMNAKIPYLPGGGS